MDKAAIDIAQALARLSELTIFELRGEWRRLHRMPPPMRLSRDLLTRGIIYQLQERAYGGLSKAALARLPLSIERIEFLLEALVGRFSGVDRAADDGPGSCEISLHHRPPPPLSKSPAAA